MKRTLSSKSTQRKLHKQKMRRPENKRLCNIYGLYDETGALRYIGQTQLLLEDRKKWFFRAIRRRITEGRSLSPLENWINGGGAFEIRSIDANATWDVSEIIYIDRARQGGANLLNVLRGGQDTLHDVSR